MPITPERRELDLAGRAHWDDSWSTSRAPTLSDPFRPGAAYRVMRRFHENLRDQLAPLGGPGRRFIEIGCARSVFLPFVGRVLDFQVEGLDYSEIGCRQAEALLAESGVSGVVTCADLFGPPTSLLSRFDVAASFGVAEHFRDTSAYLRAKSALVRPGGHLFTSIPNLAGLIGQAQRRLSRRIYDVHVPLDLEALVSAHREAGLEIVKSSYFQFTNFGVCNIAGEPRHFPTYHMKRLALAALGMMSRTTWMIEERVGDLPPNHWTSPYIFVLARKPS